MLCQKFVLLINCHPFLLYFAFAPAVRPKAENIKVEAEDEDDAVFGVPQQDIGFLKQKNQEKFLRMGKLYFQLFFFYLL